MRKSGNGSFNSHFHLSPPRRVSTDTRPALNRPYSARNGVWIEVERFHAVDRHGQSELSGGGIGDVGGVDDQRAAMLAAAGKEQPPALIADHAGQQRQGIRGGSGPAGEFLDRMDGQFVWRRAALIHRRRRAFDLDGVFASRGGNEGEINGH